MDLAAFARDYGLLTLSGVIALWGATWGVFRWAAHKEFATKFDVAGIATAMKDADDEQEKERLRLEHKVELLAKDIQNLPGFTEFNMLKDSVNDMKTELATGLAKLDALVSTIEGINDFLRRTPYDRSVPR